MTEPELEIVIVSHGAAGLLRRCLESLARFPPALRTRVTVVDSGSTDGTPDMVERDFPEVRLMRRGNIGFSAANNLVLREMTAPFVLLNPDTEVFEGALDSSLERIGRDPSIGMVGCRLVTESGALDHACSAPSRLRSPLWLISPAWAGTIGLPARSRSTGPAASTSSNRAKSTR